MTEKRRGHSMNMRMEGRSMNTRMEGSSMNSRREGRSMTGRREGRSVNRRREGRSMSRKRREAHSTKTCLFPCDNLAVFIHASMQGYGGRGSGEFNHGCRMFCAAACREPVLGHSSSRAWRQGEWRNQACWQEHVLCGCLPGASPGPQRQQRREPEGGGGNQACRQGHVLWGLLPVEGECIMCIASDMGHSLDL